MLAPRRLPSLRVDVAAPPAVEALPRMDVAVFVGFASTGPIHIPVAVETVTQYADVFGPDAQLAWDMEQGERVLAYLGGAVRAFFSNGGRRCWVIRVARTLATETLRRGGAAGALLPAPTDVAMANRFAIPGVLQIASDGNEVSAAIAVARCEGSWSDKLSVSSALMKQSIGVSAFTPIASPAAERYRFSTHARLRPGDVLEFGAPDAVSAYAIVDAVRTAGSDGDGPHVVDVTVCAAFERFGAASSPPAPSSPSSPSTAEVPGFEPASATLGLAPDERSETLRLTFSEPVPPVLAPGAWIRWSGGGETVWLRIDSITREPASNASPPATGASWIDASADGPGWRELGAGLPMPIESITQAGVLTLDLRVIESAEREFRLSGIGLTRRHPAAWWHQTTDAEYYAPRDEPTAGGSVSAAAPEGLRFPLAADDAAAKVAWIPLGVEPLFGTAVGPLPQQATALERDGLARFDAELFLDPELATTGAGTLIEYANNIRFLRDSPRELFGIHGALSIGRGGLFNEASLLVIPDAVHIGWKPREMPDADKPAPEQSPRPPHWSRHRGACAQPSAPPQEPKAGDGDARPCATDWVELCGPNAQAADTPSAAPETAFDPDFGVFLDCTTRLLAAPRLFEPHSPLAPGGYRLKWTVAEPGVTYVLREAQQADFSGAREVYRGAELEYAVAAQREGVYYYQVAAEIGDDRSAWSDPIFVVVRDDEWVTLPVNEFAKSGEARLLSVHRGALRLAAASGDLFAALALPRHYRAPEALRYAQRLRVVRPPSASDSGAFSLGEGRALSHGALYHPWVASRTRSTSPDVSLGGGARTGALRIVPPDGFAVGVLAARASARGAWIAPANEVFKDAVALTPILYAADWQALQDAQINIVREDARGFLTLSADTLAGEDEVDLRPINVRRLLILLRRLALRRGISYVFEPNGPQLRRAVEHSFTVLLTDLFRRGAFAGATAAQSFRVVTDDTINTPRDADAGRFIVELRVAPSVPMRFLSVLLAQSGERLTVAEEL